MTEELAERLGRNVRQLRDARGLTQAQMAKISGVPRATWANIESGAANPTLTVLHAVAQALSVPLEELVATPRADVKHYPAGSLPSRRRGGATVQRLLPDDLPATMIERLELAPGARLVGVPHTPGTREYLNCETGVLELAAADERYTLNVGDVVVFRGDQKHSYFNPGRVAAVGFSVILL